MPQAVKEERALDFVSMLVQIYAMFDEAITNEEQDKILDLTLTLDFDE